MKARFPLSLIALCAVATTDLGALQPAATAAPCEQYERVARADSANVEAAINLGRCTVRDEEVVATRGDSTRLAFRTDWNPALRALRRAVAADSANDRAYRLLFRMLFAETRDGCSRVTGQCLHVAPVLRRGDSLLTPPRLSPTSVDDTYREVISQTRATDRASLLEARSLAERWLSVAPNDRRPHEYVGRALLALGDSIAASNAYERAAKLGTPESRRAIFWDRFTALVKANRGIDARRLLEEAATDPGRDTTRLHPRTIASLHALLGQFRPPPIDSARRHADSVRFAEFRKRMRPERIIWTPVPSFDSLIAAGDTVNARRAAARIDSMNAPPSGGTRIPPVGQELLHSARMQLVLRDTAQAEKRLALIDGLLDERRFQFTWGLIFGDFRPWMGQAWALSGDIAAARGRPDDAARMYRRVIGLWEGGDPDTKPVVEHARTRLAALGRR